MRKSLLGFAIAASAALVALPASATTFPTLTTIYVASGVHDDGGIANAGIATSFFCSNASGVAATIRFLVLHADAEVAGSVTFSQFGHGGTTAVSTHFTLFLLDDAALSPGVVISKGSVVIESTQSGVFCTAMIVDAAAAKPAGIPLHLVRVNPHPGTVE